MWRYHCTNIFIRWPVNQRDLYQMLLASATINTAKEASYFASNQPNPQLSKRGLYSMYVKLTGYKKGTSYGSQAVICHYYCTELYKKAQLAPGSPSTWQNLSHKQAVGDFKTNEDIMLDIEEVRQTITVR